ncbi:hypothetical protein F5883DRAFT_101314 [Diaporthe sp. PMI_573]|nr:hypothetical protein F5883DRAFT_101314 [Diaporthaceae sp. PMI_573]
MLREGGARLASKLLRALCVTGSLRGAIWRGIDHLGCSGLLGRRVEGGVQVCGLHVIGPDLRRQAPLQEALQMSAWASVTSFFSECVTFISKWHYSRTQILKRNQEDVVPRATHSQALFITCGFSTRPRDAVTSHRRPPFPAVPRRNPSPGTPSM